MKSKFVKQIHSSNCIDNSLYNEKDQILLIQFKDSKNYYRYNNLSNKQYNKLFNPRISIGNNFKKNKPNLSPGQKLNSCEVLNILY